ncbi:MAG: DUF6121 family protein [Microbacteriaceae bacterium]
MKRRSIALFGSALYLAMIVAGFGFLSLALDITFIETPVWGPYQGAFMIGSSVLVFLLWQASGKVLHILSRAIATAATVFLVIPLASGIWSFFSTGSFVQLTVGIGKFALSPFVWLAALIGFVASILCELWVIYEQRKKEVP